MKKVEMAQATASLADYARDVSKEPVIVTRLLQRPPRLGEEDVAY